MGELVELKQRNEYIQAEARHSRAVLVRETGERRDGLTVEGEAVREMMDKLAN